MILGGSIAWGRNIPDIFLNQINAIKKRFGLRRLKPLDCANCLSFWICAITMFIKTDALTAILIGGIAFQLSVTISNHELYD